MTFVEKNNFRICSISVIDRVNDTGTINVKELPAKEGLGIEYRYDGEHYIVIMFAKYNQEQHEIYLENVDDRILSLSGSEFEYFKKLVPLAQDIVLCLNEEDI